MEPIDADYKRLIEISEEIAGYGSTLVTEQDTRLKVIDRILVEVLHWDFDSIQTEDHAGSGFIDYALRVDGRCRLVVEAKRDEREFGFQQHISGRAYTLDGPVFTFPSIEEGIEQCIRYCGRKNAELGCVTNGREWLVFRGSRSGDGLDTRAGKGFLFSNLDEVLKNFSLFHGLLQSENVRQHKYKSKFLEVEGQRVRRSEFVRSLRDPNYPELYPSQPISADLEKILTAFFQRLNAESDEDMLDKCFVITKESQIAESKMIRIAQNLFDRVKEIRTEKAEQLTDLIEHAQKYERKEFVIIVGTKGAGKTTFIHRFFRSVLPKEIAAHCVVIKMDLSKYPGNEKEVTKWLDGQLIEELEKIVFNGSPSFEVIQGMFYGDYQRMKSVMASLYANDKKAFETEFGRHVENVRSTDIHAYLCKVLGHIVRGRNKIPCLIFDNTDHFSFEFQERVIQYARSLYEKELIVVIVPITDRTNWQFAGHGVADSFENEILYLPAPHPKRVIERRIQFLNEKIAEEGSGNYFLQKGIRVNISDLGRFATSLQKVFVETGWTGDMIKNLSNENIRNCLELTRSVATSPYIGLDGLFKAHLSQSTFPIALYKTIQALIYMKYSWFPFKLNKFVSNIFASDDQEETSPLLGLRILALLADKSRNKRNRYHEVDYVQDYFDVVGIDRSVTAAWLDDLIKSKLCVSHDPTIDNVSKAFKVQLSPSGLQHYYWGIKEMTYYKCMLNVTPIRNKAVYSRLENYAAKPPKAVWRESLSEFVNYLISEDRKFCNIPDTPSYDTQARLINLIEKSLKVEFERADHRLGLN